VACLAYTCYNSLQEAVAMPKAGDLIRKAREKRGWNRTLLAKKSGVDRGLLCRIEDGDKSGSNQTVVRLFEILGLDLNLLKTGEPAAYVPGSP
jgi:ribosome-binding protein aMBF1 (putative translation factor)